MGNERKIVDGIHAARRAGAQLVLLPELAVTGYGSRYKPPSCWYIAWGLPGLSTWPHIGPAA